VLNLRVAALVTSGKDSAMALSRTLKRGHEVKYLVTMIPKREDSWMFHYPNIHMTEFFAEAVDIPLVKTETLGVKEDELADLKQTLAQLDIEGVVSGAISSYYQKKRLDEICQDLSMRHLAPLWHEDPLGLLKEMITLNMETVIVGVYAYGLDETWLGKKIDEDTVNALVGLNRNFEVSIVGEGGEYETLVLNAPFFKKRIQLIKTKKVWEGQSGILLIEKANLVNK
jgi:diphthine-ammonia ligase